METFDDDHQLVHELADQFRVIADQLAASGDVTAALHQVVTLARLTVPGCDGASITQVKKAQFVTLAATDQLVREVEQLQLELRQGPCLDAAAQDGCYRADDLNQDTTWPRFAAHATAATPVRSLLSVISSPPC